MTKSCIDFQASLADARVNSWLALCASKNIDLRLGADWTYEWTRCPGFLRITVLSIRDEQRIRVADLTVPS